MPGSYALAEREGKGKRHAIESDSAAVSGFKGF